MSHQIFCVHCRKYREGNPRIKNQRYCSAKECQRARKAQWQREKLASDPDYRANQRDGQKNWLKDHPEYWREYRRKNPSRMERNRILQKKRDALRRTRHLAKMDASNPSPSFCFGEYYLVPSLAKMDASLQKVFLIPTG